MITEFKGAYSWLSNFAPCAISYKERMYASVEHAYISAKSDDEEWKAFCADSNNSPGKVKRKSKKVVLREDWNLIKVAIMKELVEKKYAQAPYQQLLLDTGNCYIQEGNWWGDIFWRVDLTTNKGANKLGLLIMEIRKELQKANINQSLYQKIKIQLIGFVCKVLPSF